MNSPVDVIHPVKDVTHLHVRTSRSQQMFGSYLEMFCVSFVCCRFSAIWGYSVSYFLGCPTKMRLLHALLADVSFAHHRVDYTSSKCPNISDRILQKRYSSLAVFVVVLYCRFRMLFLYL